MRVLVISSMYPKHNEDTSGIFIHQQAIRLVNQGVDIEVVCPTARVRKRSQLFKAVKENKGIKKINRDGVPITYLPYWNVPLSFSVRMESASRYFVLSRYLKSLQANKQKFDLIHAHQLFPTGFPAMRIAKELGVPFVVSARGADVYTHPLENNGVRHFTRQTIMGSDRVTAVSQVLAQQITEIGQPTTPVKVIYNGVDVDIFKQTQTQQELRQQLNLPKKGFGLCSIGRLDHVKGFTELLQAFKIIANKHPQVWLTIVGDGPLKNDLEKWVHANGLQNRVFLVGGCDPKKVVNWLNATDAFVLTSYKEGLPNVVLEAMACALPVIATQVGGVPEAAVDGIHALLIPPREIAPIVNAIEKVIQSSELRWRLGQAAFDRIRSKFRWSQSAATLNQLYRETLNEYYKKNEIVAIQLDKAKQIS